ncbi:MAG: DEAD/DEAH box helicase [Mycobacteriaceae bacterium]|uniref:DEAD/DEAH box helicase n=1 Tax=Corynebacterium sp. TaxID=1720 RepID=UPI003F9BE9F2
MTEHRVHLLWLAGRGLHLWAERLDGHAAVMDAADVAEGDLDGELRRLLSSKPLRRREGIRVATPKGRVKVLSLPTQAYTPDQALVVLGRLSHYLRTVPGAQDAQDAQEGATASGGLSAEAVWLVKLYDFLVDIIHAGRVMVKMQFSDGQWFPSWCVASSGDHNRVLHMFQAGAPAVLTINGGPDALRRVADELVHCMCVRLLGSRIDGIGGMPDNHFVSSLVSGDPDPRATPAVAEALNEWRTSARRATTRMVLSVEEPDSLEGTVTGADRDGDPRRWRVGIRMSVDDGPAEPVVAAEASSGVRGSVREGLDLAYQAWPPLKDCGTAPEAWLRTSVWFPPPESLTGRPEKDRTVFLAMTDGEVEHLLSEGVPALSGSGIEVLVPRGWSAVRPKVTLRVTPVGQGPGAGKMGMDQVLSFDWAVSVAGEELSGAEMVELLDTAKTVVELHGRYLRLDTRSLGTARAYFKQLRTAEKERQRERMRRADRRYGPDGGSADGDAQGHLRLIDFLSSDIDAPEGTGVREDAGDLRIEAGGWVARMLRAAMPGVGVGEDGSSAAPPRIDPPEQIATPRMVRTDLRDHQRRGLNWLVWMFRHRIGAILADDMGLGKTLQVLSLLAWEREAGLVSGPTLVVAPTTVLDTWRSEVDTHVPELSVLVDHGSAKVPTEEFTERAGAADIVLTSYGTAGRNPERYNMLRWGRVVLDEAQNIKNPGTSQSQAVRELAADHRLALTGTPVENRLAELHSIMDFCNPGVLGSAQSFQNRLAIPVERYQYGDARAKLRRLVEPFIMRRVKNDGSVGLNLPEKNELIDLVPLTEEQASLYQAYTQDIEERLEASQGRGRSGIILGALVRIKQICNHPAHYIGDGSGLFRDGQHRSKKVERLFQIVRDALAEDRRVLVFTQFPTFGEMLAPELSREFATDVPVLHGGLSRTARTGLVDSFQSEDGPKVMILSTRAGGTGITLTHASVVVHIDRWWNPAVEDQATDRAYRIGQARDVTVHKLVSTGTLDERINDILRAKRELAGDVVSTGEGWIARLNDEDLAELWRLNRSSVERTSVGADKEGRQ